mgnify:FL=1|jgi:uncharacterized protein YpbB|tara:strand:+ start:421 stop:693 length:273 start_codon:yes stop_codon:yes gene_type:complete
MKNNNTAQKMSEYIQSLAAIEDCMRPFRESRKELRKNFIENSWLDKEEISLAIKAYRMWEQQVDFDNFAKIYEAVETSFIEKEGDSDSPE